MNKKPKKKKIAWQQYTAIFFFLLFGGVCGFMMMAYAESAADGKSFAKIAPVLLILFAVMYAALFLHIVIHEAGHLVFGLMSGYKFSSFRIMSFMWIKENDKIRMKHLSIAGTGGQCLMAPPDIVDGKMPVVLYNLGGSLMNVIAGSIFLGLYFAFGNIYILDASMLLAAVIGFLIALMNGVPMRLGAIDNDGYNAWSLRKNSEALEAFWVQMKVNEQTSKGVRLKDMPEEWFEIPTDESMKNSMIATKGVFACNRITDMLRFEEADKLMAHLLEIESGIIGIHRNLLLCDRVYIELITENRSDALEMMYTKELKNFMKSMKNFPSVIRTEYVYALLHENDAEKAKKAEERFEKCAKTYPYACDIQSERELIEIAKNVTI